MANPIKFKNVFGGTGTAALVDSSGDVPAAHRLRVGEWSLNLAIERSTVEVPGVAFAFGGWNKSVKATGKAKLKAYSSADILSLAPNAVRAAGKSVPYAESKTIAATVNSGKTDITDHGVDDAAGKPMTRVESTPDAGEYSLVEATGVYTFHAAEPAGNCTLYFEAADAAGFTTTISQGEMDTNRRLAFTFYASDAQTAVKSGIKVMNAKVTKLDLAVKTAEAAEYDVEFSCEADANGDVIQLPSDH